MPDSPDSTSARFRAFILAVACGAALGFAGCGGDDDDSSSSSPSTTSTIEDSGATGAEGLSSSTEAFKDAIVATGVSDDDADCIVDYVVGEGFESGLQGEEDIDSGESDQIVQDGYDSCGVEGP